MKTSELSNRQTEIMEAAAKLLTTVGVSGLTIKNLAKEMQFSESAIYRHFESKEEIILTMLDYVINGVASFGKEANYAMSADFTIVDKLKMIFREQFTFFHLNPYLAVAIFSDGLLEESARINEKILTIMRHRKAVLEPLVRQAQEKGELTKEIDAEEIVHIIMGSVRLLMYQWRVSQFSFDVIKRGEKLLNNIFKLIVLP